MRYRAFVPYSILGTGLWSATFCLIGYFASQSLDDAARVAGRGTLLFAITVGVIVAIVAAIRHLREEANRRRLVEWMEARWALRPAVALGRRVRPQARFLWKRVTPGPLGLQLTTLLAALSVGLFVLIAYTAAVTGDPGPTSADQTALDLAGDIEAGWLTAVAKVVTALGSAYVLVPLAVIVGATLRARGYRTEFWMLAAAMVIVFFASADMKHYVDRPRPPGGLVDQGGSAFPSGHAAHAILYVWLALTVTIRLRPGWAGGTALVTVGIAAAALIGLSRVYLRVHYLSDVIGGWALGISVFSLCAIVALVGSQLRQNARTDAAAGQDRA
jgi:undecaprenyl-diphosphatase